MARFKEQQHPFYKPVWVRIAIVAVISGWLLFEVFLVKSGMWMMIAGAALAYAVYMFFLAWPKQGSGSSADDGSPPA